MKKLMLACGVFVGLLGAAAALRAQDGASPAHARVTVKEIMEKTITPATNALWNVPDAPTDEQWASLEEAAITLLVAANAVGEGGDGPMDAKWAKEPVYQAFNRAMIEAGNAALAAVRARDLDGLAKAGDVLYPPCEGCHNEFNPGVVAAQ
jgi:cytochrome c556